MTPDRQRMRPAGWIVLAVTLGLLVTTWTARCRAAHAASIAPICTCGAPIYDRGIDPADCPVHGPSTP